METFIVSIRSRLRQCSLHLAVMAEDGRHACQKAADSENSTLDDIRSVTPVSALTVREVPEKHPRKDWKCFHIKEWPTYKADLKTTDPEGTILVSCFDPTLYSPEDESLFGGTVLSHLTDTADCGL